ncbi:MAG: MBL fold metallo-hydrolase [Pseudomonadales bacterium]|nr:MBL fold metallo-hydrolase [Pseudomonadales bacterium]
MKPTIQPFYDNDSSTFSYVVSDSKQKKGAIIDPVLGYDFRSGKTNTSGADELIQYIQKNQLQLDWILETHVHADHLSAAHYIKRQIGGKIAIGSQVSSVQKTFKSIFDMDETFIADGRQFDRLLKDNECFQIGDITVTTLNTPGHTPACISYLMDDAIFIGDTLFMPDYGTARCDFPGGDAQLLYHSIQRILKLPDDTKLYMCHDYGTENSSDRFISTVKKQKEDNIHIKNGINEKEFITLRHKRDHQLAMPNLIIPSVQVNIQAGQLPDAHNNGIQYLKIPLNTFG